MALRDKVANWHRVATERLSSGSALLDQVDLDDLLGPVYAENRAMAQAVRS